ncbi:MAG: fasciclin domain-containing protein [Prevotella sp.]|nr:fasciclin domain-containing protein [Prevotella sp.]
MKKLLFCASLALTGLATGCVDKNELVDEESKPEWLGGSIYEELRNPDQSKLTGRFSYYLRLVDDLGYAETLSRTGSKTVFPANDEAFESFFQNNNWGVTGYADLSDAQKKLLLYSSMLNNAMLVNMLPNVPNSADDGVSRSEAVKHTTDLSVTDTIQWVGGSNNASIRPAGMPANNIYWQRHYKDGLWTVSDATVPMMIHLTREYMLNNNITTLGPTSDFAILTGSEYTNGTAYIFDDKIIKPDVTCLNGYIHQMEKVIVPPGNMAQVLRSEDNTRLFSRMLDYFAAPYYDGQTTNDYHAYARTYGYKPGAPKEGDSIYQVRYLSQQTGHTNMQDPDRNPVSGYELLRWDPGWNQYSQQIVGGKPTLTDIGAIFAPTDKAVKDYFLEGGAGAYLIDIYGKKPNTEANLEENLDSLRATKPEIITAFVMNLMKESFANSVPSKFSTVQNDAHDNMGLTLDMLQRRDDSRYDIKIANNGVIYKLNQLIVPDEYQSVCAPSSTWDDMQVMNWAVQDGGSASKLGLDFKFYLMAMNANLAFFIPDDKAFGSDLSSFKADGEYYVNPTSLGHAQPEVLRFYWNTNTTPATLACESYRYDPKTGEVTDRLATKLIDVKNTASADNVYTQLADILNYHTVVLEPGEVIGTNHYYKTKHGGTIYLPGGDDVNATVASGQQIDNGLPASTIEEVYHEKNGRAYRLNHIIQAPTNSVYKTLQNDTCFNKFRELCNGFSEETAVLTWAGISAKEDPTFHTSDQDRYIVFTANRKSGTTTITQACLDQNVKMFNTYNYTLYAPTNAAMTAAEAAGLPTWDEIDTIVETYENVDDDEMVSRAKQRVRQMIDAMRQFVRYHFQSVSVYADNTVATATYNSLYNNELGQAETIAVSGGNGTLTVTDKGGHTQTITAGKGVVNKMARDYWFYKSRTQATSIYTSSFCAVHQVNQALCLSANGRFDNNITIELPALPTQAKRK